MKRAYGMKVQVYVNQITAKMWLVGSCIILHPSTECNRICSPPNEIHSKVWAYAIPSSTH